MGLDITIHRKDIPYGEDIWVNGRSRFGAVRNLMVEKYQYKYGEDLLLTEAMIKDLLTIVHNKIISCGIEDGDVMIYAGFYNNLITVFDSMFEEDWYFEATW